MNLRPPTPTPLTLAALLVLLTVIAYLPAINAGYIWDDDTLLTANPQMRTPAGLPEIWLGQHTRDYTPLTLTTFWLEWRLWGPTPAGYHVVNILLHALSAILLWQILLRLSIPGAWLAALLFAIHPVNVASVAWVAELKNTLSSALFLASILTFLIARNSAHSAFRTPHPALLPSPHSAFLFLLAALSKGSVVTLPAILLLCILWQDRKVTRRDLLQLLPFALIAIAAALLTIHFQARAQHYGLIPDTLAYRIIRAGAAIWLYLAALIWPAGMSPMRRQWLPDTSSPIHSLLACAPALAAAALLAILFWYRRAWSRPLLFAYAWFLIMLLPVLGFVWMTLMQQTPSADWWQYMAAPGIFALTAAAIVTASRKSRAVIPLTLILIALLMIQTWRRAAIYQSMETYCSAVTADNPHLWTLQNNLGIMLKRRARFPQAIACYRQALRDNPYYVEAHVNLANVYSATGNLPAAQSELQLANQIRPHDPLILQNLAQIHNAQAHPPPPAHP